MQTDLQKIRNQWLSLKHPDTFVLEDRNRKAKFKGMDLKIQSSQVWIDLERATKELFQKANITKEDIEIETRSRDIR